MSEKVIELVHLQKQFGENTVLRDINLSVSKGEVLSIIGASGSGKSTMLRCINLLETPTSGQILYHGKDITGHDINLSQYRAKVGMVFQSFNLFNNMTALNNCITGQVSVLKRSREEAEARRHGAVHKRTPLAALGRPEAARRDCARTGYGAGGAAV